MEKSITVAKSYNHKDIICLGLGLGSCEGGMDGDGEVVGGRGGDVGTKPTENKYNLMVHGKLLGCTLQIFTKQICSNCHNTKGNKYKQGLV